MKRKIAFAVIIFIPMIILGGWNIYKRVAWREPSDGVVWAEQVKGLTALKVERNSQASMV
jgi:hypothetical protein